jgi:hypothetical protein
MAITRRDALRRVGWSAVLFGAFRAVPAAGAATRIQLENAKAGTTAWQLGGPVAKTGQLEGYTSRPSVNIGETIRFFVTSADPSFTLQVFRVGWYGGRGGRAMTSQVSIAGRRQVIPVPDPLTGLIEAEWLESYALKVPRTWTSGVYLVKLVSQPRGLQRYMIFVVRNDGYAAPYLMQTSVNTYQAYNGWGGKSLYSYNSTGAQPARIVSFDRPYDDGAGAGQFFAWEIHMVRFLEREGYDVTYTTNLDLDAQPGSLLTHRAFLSVGHDEYWSWRMRQGVETARAQGVHLGFFSSNTCFWQIRYGANSRGLLRRRIICYKHTALEEDPFALDANRGNNQYVTTRWRDWPVNLPEDALIGVMYHGDPFNGDIVVSNAAHWIYAGSGLRNGDRLTGLLGYETDASFGNAPAGTQVLAHSPDPWGFSDMTVYRWPSGAWVFATGSMQFTWGLDAYSQNRVNPAAQQITRNVLSRFVAVP